MCMRSRVLFALAIGVASISTPLVAAKGAAGSQAPAAKAVTAATPAPDVQAFVKQYCVTCHNERNKAAVSNLVLEKVDTAAAGQHGEIWEKVVMKLRAGQMPPLSARRPDRALSDQVAAWLESELDRHAAARPNPGRTESLHRLNRTEYKNAVRDLLGLDIDVYNMLPPDPLGGGDANFDNIASSLRISQSLLERYVSAARKVSRTALAGNVPSNIQTFKPPQGLRQDVRLPGMPFGTRGGFYIDYVFPLDAIYKIDLTLGRGLGGDGFGGAELPGEIVELSVDGEQVKAWEIRPAASRTEAQPAAGAAQMRGRAPAYTIDLPVKAGEHRLMATFKKVRPTVEQEGDRLPFVGQQLPGNALPPGVSSMIVTGPIKVLGKADTDSRRRILTCMPRTEAEEEPCARQILTTLARRGFRRPTTNDDMAYLMRFYQEGRKDSNFDNGIERAVRALLVSPEFLFRTETEPAGVAPGAPYRVSDLELASRLSFFLWSSIPDDELLNVAVKGQLKTPAVLEKQVRRMLQDPRSEALTKSFASFYLWIRNVENTQMDADLYPNFDQTLRQAMAKETELFFDSVRAGDRSVLTLLDADYTYLNERLALHYGIPGVKGPDFRRVQLSPDSPRRGILGKASILLVTSVPTRTSPVKRGKWILDNVLGTPPPSPPANIPPLGEQKQDDGRVLSLREMMAKHRSNPICAGCHNTIDPLGFALEQFDAIGKWRQVDRSFTPIDPTGTMPDGSKFGTLGDFRKQIIANPGPFLRTFTEKMLIYALGRPFESYDAPAVRQVLRGAAAGNYKFSDIVVGIVKSAPFQMRRAAAAADGTRSAN
jgi:mono/diheme cytochrome c family protein